MKTSEIIITVSQLLSLIFMIGIIIFALYKAIKERYKFKHKQVMKENIKKPVVEIIENLETKQKKLSIRVPMQFSHVEVDYTEENLFILKQQITEAFNKYQEENLDNSFAIKA